MQSDRSAVERSLRLLAPVLFGLVVLAVWELLVRVNSVPHYILPGPLAIMGAMWTDGAGLLAALWITLRIAIGALGIAAILGGSLAVAMAQSRWAEASLLPYAIFLQVTPIVSIAPLIIIWADDVTLSLLICAVIVAFFPIVSNTILGLHSTDRGLLDLFKLAGATRLQTLCYLRIPTALPHFLAGLRISGGLALIGAVVAEFVAGTGGVETGLASRILEAGNRLQIPRLFAALILLSLAGLAIHLVLGLVTRRLLARWHESALPTDR
ncbi:MAG: ABC transporter permease [Alphaproteobacteria bacterium]